MQKIFVIIQPGKVLKNFFWSVSMEKKYNIPDLIF